MERYDKKMTKQDKERHNMKMDRLIALGFFKDRSNDSHDYDHEKHTYENKQSMFHWEEHEQYFGWSDLLNKRNWLYMEYKTATPTDVRDQCFVCSELYDIKGYRYEYPSNSRPRNSRKDWLPHMDKIIEVRRGNRIIRVGDVVVRNGYGTNFLSYHLDCARYILECVMDTIHNGLKRSKEIDEIVDQQRGENKPIGGKLGDEGSVYLPSWRNRYQW